MFSPPLSAPIASHPLTLSPSSASSQAKQLQDELTDVLRSSAAANGSGSTAANTATYVDADANAIGVSRSPPLPGTTATNVVNFNAGKVVDTAVKPTSMGTPAVTGSTRSNSVASEGLGSIQILHEEGLNSDAGGGGAYLEVCAEHLDRTT